MQFCHKSMKLTTKEMVSPAAREERSKQQDDTWSQTLPLALSSNGTARKKFHKVQEQKTPRFDFTTIKLLESFVDLSFGDKCLNSGSDEPVVRRHTLLPAWKTWFSSCSKRVQFPIPTCRNRRRRHARRTPKTQYFQELSELFLFVSPCRPRSRWLFCRSCVVVGRR